MTDAEREEVEEAHGLWEIAVTRLAALAVTVVPEAAGALDQAHRQEREAYARWTAVVARVVDRPAAPQ